MIASLQMYDWHEAQNDNDLFWKLMVLALHSADIAAPAELTRGVPPEEVWADPGLLLGQTCGLPYAQGRCGEAVLVARPIYKVPGCGRDASGRGTYSSAVIVRRSDMASLPAFRERRAAINDPGSLSGCLVLAGAVSAMGAPFFGSVTITGEHRKSALAVAEGKADIAAIDALSWALFAEVEPEAHAELGVILWTEPMPSLPYITAPQFESYMPLLRAALSSAAATMEATVVPYMLTPSDPADYSIVTDLAQQASEIFGPNLELLAEDAAFV